MKISWIAAHNYQWPQHVSVDDVKKIGPVWSSWRAWRTCHSDNVVCDDFGHAKTLLARAFHSVCNLYLPRRLYQDLSRPHGMRWYDGHYTEDTISIEDIIAMHLCSVDSDIVFVLGFDFAPIVPSGDALHDHRVKNQKGLVRQVIMDNPQVQWVVLDHEPEFDTAFQNLDNVLQDVLANALLLEGQ